MKKIKNINLLHDRFLQLLLLPTPTRLSIRACHVHRRRNHRLSVLAIEELLPRHHSGHSKPRYQKIGPVEPGAGPYQRTYRTWYQCRNQSIGTPIKD